jgi:hypothetical protein
MTETEFFAYINLNDHAGNVNIWYLGNNPSTIYGISIPVLTQEGQNIAAKLAQVQQITIPFPDGTNAVLNITSRSQNQSPNNTGYYVFLVTPVNTNSITQTTVSGDLYFSPDIDTYEFSISPYNVIGGTVEDNRESNYAMSADNQTAGGTVVPTGYSGPANIYQLLSGSAPKAIIQDSNYSITGWTNARYQGTKTDVTDYNSPPSLTGTVFQGSNYPITVPFSNIQNQISSSIVIYSDYFYAGAEETPGYFQKQLVYQVSQSTSPLPVTEFFIKPQNTDILTGSIALGDLIQVGNSDEVMRVTLIAVPPNVAPGTLRIRVVRNVGNLQPFTPTVINTNNEQISRVQSVQIFEVEGNRLNGIVRGYMVVQSTGEVLTLDSNGFVTGEGPQ